MEIINKSSSPMSQDESPEHRDAENAIGHLQIDVPPNCNLARRDSESSIKSLRSYYSVRESFGKMHSYVDKVNKLD
jgi:hypothetical protein